MPCNHPKPVTRRQALSLMGGGFGLVALSNMLNASLAQASSGTGGVLKELHFKPRAKRVIFLFMNGGVSHVDTFDPKPMLEKYDGKPMPIGSPLWSSAFLPAMYQGTVVHNTYVEDEQFQASKIIPNVTNSKDRELQSRDIGFLRELNEMHLSRLHDKDAELEASIKSMETAFRMQTEAPD